MQPYGDPDAYYHTPFLLKLLRRNLPILVFLLSGLVGMVAIYLYYTGESGDVVTVSEAITEEQIANELSAPIAPLSKEIKPLPVKQRRAQSPAPIRIGLVAGHRGFDSGALCSDGLTEVQITSSVVERLAVELRKREIIVDTLDEFDPRLDGYAATALISVHADSCDYINELATGFKISGSSYVDSSELSICMQQRYAEETQLPYHPNSITPHMVNYHAFSKIDSGTPAVIIEIGFLNLDRVILTDDSEMVVNGLLGGINCLINQSR